MKLITFDIKLIARMSLKFLNSLPLIVNSLRGKLRNELESQSIENIYSYKIYIYLLHHSHTPARARVICPRTRAREGEMAMSLIGSFRRNKTGDVDGNNRVVIHSCFCAAHKISQKTMQLYFSQTVMLILEGSLTRVFKAKTTFFKKDL